MIGASIGVREASVLSQQDTTTEESEFLHQLLHRNGGFQFNFFFLITLWVFSLVLGRFSQTYMSLRTIVFLNLFKYIVYVTTDYSASSSRRLLTHVLILLGTYLQFVSSVPRHEVQLCLTVVVRLLVVVFVHWFGSLFFAVLYMHTSTVSQYQSG